MLMVYFVEPRSTSGRLSDSVEPVDDVSVSESCCFLVCFSSAILVLLEALVFADVDGVAVALDFRVFAGVVVESASVGFFLFDACGPPS